MLFFVIEDFHGSDRKEIYRRFRDKGRLKPDELVVHHSWIAGDMSRCFMLVEADDATVLQRWGHRMGGSGRVRDRSGGQQQGHGRGIGYASLKGFGARRVPFPRQMTAIASTSIR